MNKNAANDSEVFIKALKDQDIQALRTVGKADRHCHGLLGADLGQWAKEMQFDAPHVPDCFEDFHDFQVLVDELFYYKMSDRTKQAIRERIKNLYEATIKAAIHDGVTLLQPSLDASLWHYFESHDAYCDFIVTTGSVYRDKIRLEPELGMARVFDADRLRADALPLIESTIFYSIDFYADERNDGLDAARPLYSAARRAGMRLKAHAGELCDAAYVQKSVEYLELDEVQHGIAAANDTQVMDFLSRCGTLLNICPTSNIRLRCANSYASHPLRILLDNGVAVSVNSDDRMVFDSPVSQEFLQLYRSGNYSAQELDAIRQRGLSA